MCEGVAHGGDDGVQVLPSVLHHAVPRPRHHVPQQTQQSLEVTLIMTIIRTTGECSKKLRKENWGFEKFGNVCSIKNLIKWTILTFYPVIFNP